MSTPIIWLLLPLLLSLVGLFFTRRRLLLKWSGTSISLLLGLSAVIIPINQKFNFLLWELNISDQLLIFGRRFILSPSDQPAVILIFLSGFIWFLILDPEHVPVQCVPLGLTSLVLILTTYSVEPLFYGAIFFAFLALVSVVLLTPPGSTPTPGVLRFLIFQILGMLFILFAAWLASWIDINAGNQYLLQSSMLLLGLGFAFLLAIFPFMSWLAMIGEKNHSFLVAFVYSNYFFGIILFGIRFILEGGWLSPDVNIQLPLQATGLLMLGTGGILAVFTRHLGRLTGVIAMGYIGRMLLSISLFLNGFPILFAVVIIHILALGLWSLSLSILRELSGELSYQKIEGGWWQWPLVTSGIVLGYYCLAGLPPLAGFPIYWALGSGLSGISFSLALVYAAASSGYIIGGLRLISVLAKNSGEEFVLLPGRPFYRYVILVLMLGLILLGIFPGFLLEITESISTVLVSF